MNRRFLFIITILIGALWTLGVTVVSYQRGQKTIENAEKMYLDRVTAMGSVLASSIRSDLLRGNIRESIRTLEGFRGTGFLSGYRIESPNLDKIYTGVNQKIKDTDVVHTETLTYSMEPSDATWGKVDFVFSSDEVAKLKSDLNTWILAITLISAASVGLAVLLIGLMFSFFNAKLSGLLQKSLIDRRKVSLTNYLKFIFEPMLKMIETLRIRLDQADLDQQAYVENITLYKTARQIAHDIQGPVTFMKFFAKKYEQSNPEDAKNIFLATDRLEKMGAHLLKKGNSLDIPLLSTEELIKRFNAYILYKSEEVAPFKIQSEVALKPQPNEQMQIDYALFERVIDNLINNAVDAMRDSPHHLVTVQMDRLERGVHVQIRDQGPGMSAAATDAFHNHSSGFTSKTTGHGLGLPFCKQVVTQASGRITYENSAEKGSSFSIWIPLYGGTLS